MNPELESNLKHLEEKLEQAINLISSLKQENSNLKAELTEKQSLYNQAVDRINFILDNINKLL
jgi:DNA repair exonuclease SbcCD ATPase subunit